MMHKWFWFSSDLGSFLIPGYNVISGWGLFSTCLGLLSLAVVYEAMKVLQINLHRKTVSSLPPKLSTNSENSSLLTHTGLITTVNSTTSWQRWSSWILEVLHWSVHTTLGYILMLAVMTFNGYIGIALVIGASFGYWIFGMTLIQLNLAQFNQSRMKDRRCDAECADAVGRMERRPSAVSLVAEQLAAEVESVTEVKSVVEIHALTDV